MKQYCRYCYGCSEGDCYYCSVHEKVLSEAQIERVNNCPDFGYCTLGDVITGKQYQPREPKQKPEFEQLKMQILEFSAKSTLK